MELGVIEVVVPRKKSSLLGVAKVLCTVLAVILIFLGLTVMNIIGLWALIPLVLGVAAGIGAYFASMNSNVDFEYSLVDRELRVAKILNKERRKSMAKYDLDKLEIMAPMKSHELDSYRNRQNTKEADYSTRDASRENTTYWCFLEGNQKIVLDLAGSDGEKLLNAVKMFAPRKVRNA